MAGLFQPGYIGKLRIKNRIIQAPMSTRLAARDGSVTPQLLSYYKERAKGGQGLIIVEFANIDQKASQTAHCQLGIYDNSLISGLAILARGIKDNGARAAIQICHGGSQRFLGYPLVAPSPVPWEALGGIIPTELTNEEIKEIVKAFGNAARIAQQADFDMIEIHGAHGYLINEFLSPYTNKRSDVYGGSLTNRMRFALEILDSVRKNVGRDFPVSMRISGSEYIENGLTIEQSKDIARELEKAGIDVIHVSGGSRATISAVVPMIRPLVFNVPLAEAIKRVVRIPVIASGSINSPQLAEEILEKEQGDFISLARPLLADPLFANKIKEGSPEDIVPCIRCNEGCLLRGTGASRPVSCTVNAAAPFEEDFRIEPVAKSRKIAVIGGGPGGMEASRVATLRGHSVTLYEKRDRLGGYLIEGSVPEFKKDVRNLIDYLSTQLWKLKVKVILGKEATVKIVQEQGFDAIILAIGSTPLVPDIPGIDKQSVMTAIDVLRAKQVGQNNIVVGGGLVGCEIALFLAEQGKKMRIIEMLDNVGMGMDKLTKQAYFEGFSKHGVELNPGLKLKEVVDGGIIAVDRDGEKHNIEADSVILACGFKSRDDLLEGLEKTDIPVYPVGDCIEPRKIYDAIHEGFLAGYHLY